jgi:hypothetical protein
MLSSFKSSRMRLKNCIGLVLAMGGLAVSACKPMAETGYAGQDDKPEARAVAQREGAAPTAGGKPSGGAAITEVVEFFPRPTEAERKILAALEKPVDAEFREKSLKECLDNLETQSKIDFWVDSGKMQEEGISVDQHVTLKIKGRRLESVLHLLLEPVQLDYFYEDEVLKITTAASASEKLVTRTYPVNDLCPEPKEDKEPAEGGVGGGIAPKTTGIDHGNSTMRLALFQGFGGGGQGGGMGGPGRGGGMGGMGGGMMGGMIAGKRPRFTPLMNAITTSVRPDSWEELSGPGSVVPVATSNSLVIRQTQSVHREILQLLRDLRAAQRVTQPAPPARTAGDGNARG